MSGVEAHIRGDMADALFQSYVAFSNRYGLWNRKFDEYKDDFFETNKRLFQQVSGLFFNYLLRMIYPGDSRLAAFAFGSIENLMPSLSIDTIYQWRETAWADAKQRIESI